MHSPAWSVRFIQMTPAAVRTVWGGDDRRPPPVPRRERRRRRRERRLVLGVGVVVLALLVGLVVLVLGHLHKGRDTIPAGIGHPATSTGAPRGVEVHVTDQAA